MAYRLSQKALEQIGRKIWLARKKQKRRALDIAIESKIEPSYYSKIVLKTFKTQKLLKVLATN